MWASGQLATGVRPPRSGASTIVVSCATDPVARARRNTGMSVVPPAGAWAPRLRATARARQRGVYGGRRACVKRPPPNGRPVSPQMGLLALGAVPAVASGGHRLAACYNGHECGYSPAHGSPVAVPPADDRMTRNKGVTGGGLLGLSFPPCAANTRRAARARHGRGPLHCRAPHPRRHPRRPHLHQRHDSPRALAANLRLRRMRGTRHAPLPLLNALRVSASPPPRHKTDVLRLTRRREHPCQNRISCRSRTGTTSSSTSVTQSKRLSSTTPPSASSPSPMRASRRACATAPAT